MLKYLYRQLWGDVPHNKWLNRCTNAEKTLLFHAWAAHDLTDDAGNFPWEPERIHAVALPIARFSDKQRWTSDRVKKALEGLRKKEIVCKYRAEGCWYGHFYSAEERILPGKGRRQHIMWPDCPPERLRRPSASDDDCDLPPNPAHPSATQNTKKHPLTPSDTLCHPLTPSATLCTNKEGEGNKKETKQEGEGPGPEQSKERAHIASLASKLTVAYRTLHKANSAQTVNEKVTEALRFGVPADKIDQGIHNARPGSEIWDILDPLRKARKKETKSAAERWLEKCKKKSWPRS